MNLQQYFRNNSIYCLESTVCKNKKSVSISIVFSVQHYYGLNIARAFLKQQIFLFTISVYTATTKPLPRAVAV